MQADKENVHLSASSFYVPSENAAKYLNYGAGTSEVICTYNNMFIYARTIFLNLIFISKFIGDINSRLRLIFLLEQPLFLGVTFLMIVARA
jgi:hypothetical protein